MPLHAILDHLGLAAAAPTLPFLDRLLLAWAGRIPWESAARIARHQLPGSPSDYARRPEAFFADALRLGTGGTCFESNLALKALLDALGFHSTLTFCDMKEGGAWQVDPHSACLVTVDGARVLADVGYPVPAALRLDPDAPVFKQTPIYRYEVAPVAEGRWIVRRTSGTFRQDIFWLKGEPVKAETFWARLVRDHEPDGFFLDNVIIHRLDAAGGQMWRFDQGKGLVRRTVGREEVVPFTDAEQADLPGALARRFAMDVRVIEAALTRCPPDGVWGGIGTKSS